MPTYSFESVLWFELLCCVHVVVDACKASGSASTECGGVAECEDDVGGGAVEGCELLLDVILGDVGLTRVDNINDLYRVSLNLWLFLFSIRRYRKFKVGPMR